MTFGLFDPQAFRPVAWGRSTVPSPLFLTTALAWGVVTAIVGMKIVKWIAAIMQYFPVFPAVGLAVAMAANLTGLGDFRPSGVDPTTGRTVAINSGLNLSFLSTFQWTFGFTALLGITGADWGLGSVSQADVRKGGWVGLVFAPVVVAILAMLAVAGHEGKVQARAEISAETVSHETGPRKLGPPIARSAPATETIETDSNRSLARFTFRSVLESGLDRRIGASLMLIFGLASLAPSCYASYEFGRRLHRFAPVMSKRAWTMVGVTAGWFLIVAGWYDRTELVFVILGGLFAPVAGAMVADASRQPGQAWPGPRPGVNGAGLIAWLVGVMVGLAPIAGQVAGVAALSRLTPAALLAFVAAFVAYRIAALVGLEPRVVMDAKSP